MEEVKLEIGTKVFETPYDVADLVILYLSDTEEEIKVNGIRADQPEVITVLSGPVKTKDVVIKAIEILNKIDDGRENNTVPEI